MIEDGVQPVSRQDLITALQVFITSNDDDWSSDDVDARVTLVRIAKMSQINDPYRVLALFDRCVAIRNAARDGLFEADDDGAIPDQAMDLACVLPVVSDSYQPTAMRFDRNQFMQAMQGH